MTNDRFRQVEEIFHAALAVDPDDRSAFLDVACGGDAALRAEVAALIARERSAEAMFSALDTAVSADPAATDAGASIVGSRVGVYEIGALIGAGGMGRVYRARDTRLGRDVAIKVLPRALLSHPDRVARFEREARVLASLSHPHIATLYGMEESDGVRALVLELVDGPTLAQLIAGSAGAGLSIALCERIARQIADALDAAHQAGIVHRDLKPANVKVTPDGVVKVLDFGLARMNPEMHGGFPNDAATREGTIVGTPAYMSPEQARGQNVDRRADIWAFGCILFEMLAGRAVFDRPTAADTLGAVLQEEPDWRALPATTPPALVRLIGRCLAKTPSARLRDIGDAWLEPERADPGPPKPAWSRAPVAALVLGTAAIATAAGWMLGAGRRDQPAGELIQFHVGLPPGHAPLPGIAVTMDGRRLALGTFGSGPMIWLHELGTGDWESVPNTEMASAPFWSPDGSSLGYFSGGQLWRTDAGGGPAIRLAPAIGWLGASWGSRGVIVYSSGYELFTVPAAGGDPTKIAMPETGGKPAMRTHPWFLPDGRRFIYHERSESGSGIYAGSIDGGFRKHLVDSTEPAAVAPPGSLLFVRGTALVAQPFELETLTLRGQPKLVATDAAPGFLSGHAAFSASLTGVLAFVRSREGTRGKLVWFDHAGQPVGSIDQPEQIEYLNPAISPDGARVAVNRMDPQTGNWDIWTIDVVRGVRTRVTSSEANDSDPVWSPDGTQIAFASDRGGAAGIYRKAADGSGPEQRLFQSDRPGVVLPTDWSRDGTIVLSESRFPPTGWAISLLHLADGSVSRLPDAGPIHYAGRVSPNGQWLAYASTETGIFEVYVQPLSGPGSKVQVSRGGGTHPRWTADGRRLFYWAQPGGIKSVDIQAAAGQVRAGAPQSVIAVRIPELIDGRPHYDVTRDGRRFLLRQPIEAAEPPVGVIVNWTRKIAR